MALGEARAEIDALNVYPVPDGDTGTNLYLTMESAVEALGPESDDATAERGLGARCRPRRTARGARQLRGDPQPVLPGGVEVLADPTPRPGAELLRLALREAARGRLRGGRPAGRGHRPQRRPGRRRGRGAVAGDDLVAVAMAAADGAQAALDRTPEQLEALRRAGVVDAGGRGAVVLLDALVDVVTRRRPGRHTRPAHLPSRPSPAGEVMEPGAARLRGHVPAGRRG